MKAAWAKRKLNAAFGETASELNEAMFGDKALPKANPMDDQLVREFIGNCLVTRQHRDENSIGVSFIPWSQIDAVLRRLDPDTVFDF